MLTSKKALASIAAIMSGEEWNADTLDAIAVILELAGYDVRDSEDES